MKKDGMYYLIYPGIYDERRALKYEVKNWKIWRITVYNKYWRVDSVYDRESKLELLNNMGISEEYGDYEDCFYESEELFKDRIKRWKSMN